MTPTVAVCFLLSSFFLMMLFFVLRFHCAPSSTQKFVKDREAGADTTNTANAACGRPSQKASLAPISRREYVEHGTTSPASDYSISITDEDADLDNALTTKSWVNRATSYLRFAGSTRSDECEVERVSSFSFWNDLLLRYTVGSPPTSPSSDMSSTDSEHEVDAIQILDVYGDSRWGALSVKPPRPRSLSI